MIEFTDIVLLLSTGVAAGAVNAVAGGGSLIVFPALLAIGLNPLAANVTNAIAQWPGYVSMVVGTRHDLGGTRRRLILTCLAVIAGAALGCLLLLVLPSAIFDIVVPPLIILASVLMAVAPHLKKVLASPRQHGQDRLALLLPAVFIAGVYGGYFGGALGVVLIAALSLFAHDTLRRLNAWKGVLSIAASTVTVLVFAVHAPVYWVAVAIIGPATLLGGFLGGRLSRRLPEGILRALVVTLGLSVGIYLAIA